MSKKDVLDNFRSDLLTLHDEDLYFVLNVILPMGTNIPRFISELKNEKATI